MRFSSVPASAMPPACRQAGQAGVARMLERFVRFRTVSSESNAALAREVGRHLAAAGFRVHYQKRRLGGKIFLNVIGTKGRGGRPLLLCAHLDTVPAGDTRKWTKTRHNPWKPVRRGGRIYGLGSADDKASMVAMLLAAASVAESELASPLVVLGTFGEESGMGGARLFTRRWKGPKPACACVGEPTSLGVTWRHKGMGVLVIELKSRLRGRFPAKSVRQKSFRGRQGHSSRPWTGDNALRKAAAFLETGGKQSAVLGLSGGFAPNLIPDSAALAFSGLRAAAGRSERRAGSSAFFPAAAITACVRSVDRTLRALRPARDASFYPAAATSNFGVARTRGASLFLTFDFRLLPGQNLGRVVKKFARRLAAAFKKIQGVSFKIAVERDNPPLGLARSHPLVRHAAFLLSQNGLPARLHTKPSCTEAGIYARWGVPAVVFGPGASEGNIHSPNESVKISEILTAAQVYRALIGNRKQMAEDR